MTEPRIAAGLALLLLCCVLFLWNCSASLRQSECLANDKSWHDASYFAVSTGRCKGGIWEDQPT